MDITPEINSNFWECARCGGLSFASAKLLRKHKREHHKSNGKAELQYNYTYSKLTNMYNCNTCDIECASREEIESHILEHEEKYACKVCDENFNEIYNCSIHMHNVHCKTNFQCAACDFTTQSRTSLLTHIKIIHLKSFIYMCKECKKGFNDKIKYKEHVERHYSDLNFECVVCNKKYPYSQYLATHQKRYHTVSIEGTILPNQCQYCKKRFAKETSLKNHMKVHEPRSGPWKKTHLCDICGKGFGRKDKLTIHYRVHTGIKPYKCSYCEKSFIKSDYLKMHERIHNGEKPYSCQYCGRSFNQGAPLRIHLRLHTGDKPFSCSICSNSFVSRGALNVHMKQCADKEIIDS